MNFFDRFGGIIGTFDVESQVICTGVDKLFGVKKRTVFRPLKFTIISHFAFLISHFSQHVRGFKGTLAEGAFRAEYPYHVRDEYRLKGALVVAEGV